MMKRQKQNRNNRVSSRRNLRIESLEDRRLLTVAAEFADEWCDLSRQNDIGSEHLPSVAEIAVEKATDGRLGLHNNGAYRDPASIQAFGEEGFSHQPDSVIILKDESWYRDPASTQTFGEEGFSHQPDSVIILEDHWPYSSDLANIAVEKIAVEKIAVEKLFNRMGLQNRNSVMDPTDCPDVIDGLESAGIEADQSAGRMVDTGFADCDTIWVDNGCRADATDDATSDLADGNCEAAAEDSSKSTDDTSNSLMIDDDDEGKDDEAPGLPGEDGILDPDPGSGRIDPAETAGSDGDKEWDVLQDSFFPPGW